MLGLTGGLAAPLIGAGVGTILGAGSAAVLGSAAGIAIIGSLFGVAGAGLTGMILIYLKLKKPAVKKTNHQNGSLKYCPLKFFFIVTHLQTLLLRNDNS